MTDDIRCPFERGLAAYRKHDPVEPKPVKRKAVQSSVIRGVVKAAHILRDAHGGQYSKAKGRAEK